MAKLTKNGQRMGRPPKPQWHSKAQGMQEYGETGVTVCWSPPGNTADWHGPWLAELPNYNVAQRTETLAEAKQWAETKAAELKAVGLL